MQVPSGSKIPAVDESNLENGAGGTHIRKDALGTSYTVHVNRKAGLSAQSGGG